MQPLLLDASALCGLALRLAMLRADAPLPATSPCLQSDTVESLTFEADELHAAWQLGRLPQLTSLTLSGVSAAPAGLQQLTNLKVRRDTRKQCSRCASHETACHIK